MNKTDHKLKVAMFSGGRGTGALTGALLKYPNIELTLLVNAYDDGLSTGLLRKFIPGMLGPSDIRKNVSRFVAKKQDRASQALNFLLEYRLPKDITTEDAIKLLESFINVKSTEHSEQEILKAREGLALSQAKKASHYLRTFLDYYDRHKDGAPWFGFDECSLGNFLFGGCYLVNDQDFNKTIDDFSRFAGIGNHVLNLTKGENRVLVAMKEDGQYLHDEASVVSPQSASRIEEIFLLPDYLDQKEYPLSDDKIRNKELLRRLEQLPNISSDADKILREADIIIYGPGTQYSSLLPSYLTHGIAEAIRANTHAEKIFIGNIARDHDILGEDATSLVRAFLHNMARKGGEKVSAQELVSRFFFQKPEVSDSGETSYFSFNADEFEYPLDQVTWLDLEGESGKHAGSTTISELLLVVEDTLKKEVKHVSQKVSIIVPALNEEKTVKKVLGDLIALDFSELNLEKEIIFIDGGSTDKTFKLASEEAGVRTYQLQGEEGRGHALRLGLEKAKGDIVVFFPSDDEYRAKDITRVISPLVTQDFPVVFGSRAFRSYDLSGTLERVYEGKGSRYVASKYGGMLLSIMTLLIYKRFVSDPLTSIKGFNRRIIRSMNFSREGVDFDLELIAKMARSGHIMLEVPVSYVARTVSEGKKTTVWDGFKSLWTLFRFAKWRPKYSENSHA